jgi:hypothetical protein
MSRHLLSGRFRRNVGADRTPKLKKSGTECHRDHHHDVRGLWFVDGLEKRGACGTASCRFLFVDSLSNGRLVTTRTPCFPKRITTRTAMDSDWVAQYCLDSPTQRVCGEKLRDLEPRQYRCYMSKMSWILSTWCRIPVSDINASSATDARLFLKLFL